MVLVCGRSAAVMAALVAVAATGAAGSTQAPGGMSLQLHRVPSAPKHHETYQRRRLVGNGYEVVPLNPGMGTHYAWVYAGTPPQRASVITDTGSSIMAFPCSGCANCGDHTDPPFTPDNSSTLTHVTCGQTSFFHCEGCGGADDEKKTCDISQSYMEGSSWQASVVEDIVYLGGAESGKDTNMRNMYGTHFQFGCQSHETGLFITQVADGIMGLANNDHHIVAKLYKEKKIPNKLFTLCFAPEGGSMAIGAPDVSRHKGDIQYAQLVKTLGHDFYGVELRDVRVGGSSIEAPATSFKFGQYIVDSGTTDSYLPSSMKQKFQEAFKKVSGLDYQVSSSLCKGYSDEDLEKLPNVELVLGAVGGANFTLTVTPSQYLLKEDNGKYCSSIFLSESSGGVIGANIMMDHDVIFDQENQRVGFVKADCDYRRLPVSDGGSNSTLKNGTVTPAPISNANSTETPVPVATLGVESEFPESTKLTSTTITPPPSPTATLGVEPTDDSEASEAPEPSITLGVEPTTSPVNEQPSTMPAPSVTPEAKPEDATPPMPTATLGVETPTPSASSEELTPDEVDENEDEVEPSTTPLATQTAAPPKTPVPAPTTGKTSVIHSGTHTAADVSTKMEDEHPIVLTVVGTVLAVLFIMGVAYSVRRHKRTSREQWSRVKGNEEDEEEDDEEELIDHSRGNKPKAHKSDEVDEEEEDEEDLEAGEVRHGGRLADSEYDDDDDDDEDDIFDREAESHDAHKHDTRVLERL